MKTHHWQTPRGSIFTSKSTILQWTIYMTGSQHQIVCCCRSNQINKFLHVPYWNSNDFFHHQKWQCNSLLSLYTNAPCLSFIHIDNLCRIIYFSLKKTSYILLYIAPCKIYSIYCFFADEMQP